MYDFLKTRSLKTKVFSAICEWWELIIKLCCHNEYGGCYKEKSCPVFFEQEHKIWRLKLPGENGLF